jgi:hypothetical protein
MDMQARLEILELLANGKITAAEAADLLEGKATFQKESLEETSSTKNLSGEPTRLNDVETLKAVEYESLSNEALKIEVDEVPDSKGKIEPLPQEHIIRGNGKKPRWLRIRVRELDTGRNRVSVNLPLGLVSFGLGVARRFNNEMGELDIDEMMAMIKQGEQGVLVDVQDEEDNEHVEIYLD